jgi:hypothetical protein
MLLNMSTEQLCPALCHNSNDATYDAIDELSNPDLLQLQQAMLKRFEDPGELLFNLTSHAIECLISNVNYINDQHSLVKFAAPPFHRPTLRQPAEQTSRVYNSAPT